MVFLALRSGLLENQMARSDLIFTNVILAAYGEEIEQEPFRKQD